MSDTNFSKPEWPQEENNNPSRYEAPKEEVAYNAHDGSAEEGGKSATPLVVISLIIGFGIGWFVAGGDDAKRAMVLHDELDDDDAGIMMDDHDDDDDTNIEPPVQNEAVVTPPTSVAVVVNDQFAGDRVVIDTVRLPARSWVAIYESNESDQPGSILGARRFDVGDHAGVSIELLRNTELDRVNFVIVHTDDGDADFEKFEDIAVTNSDGSTFSVPFKTTLGSARGNE